MTCCSLTNIGPNIATLSTLRRCWGQSHGAAGQLAAPHRRPCGQRQYQLTTRPVAPRHRPGKQRTGITTRSTSVWTQTVAPLASHQLGLPRPTDGTTKRPSSTRPPWCSSITDINPLPSQQRRSVNQALVDQDSLPTVPH
jgi:hypothetical protein